MQEANGAARRLYEGQGFSSEAAGGIRRGHSVLRKAVDARAPAAPVGPAAAFDVVAGRGPEGAVMAAVRESGPQVLVGLVVGPARKLLDGA